MPRKWISSTDVQIDDDGRVAVTLPSELIQDGRVMVDAGGGVGGGADLMAITGDPARTLADIYSALFDGGSQRTLAQIVSGGLTNSYTGQPWLSQIDATLSGNLFSSYYGQPWAAHIDNVLAQVLSSLDGNLYSPSYGPWLGRLDATLNANLFDPSYGKSLVAWVRDSLFDPYYGQTVTAMLRGALFDGGTTPWLSELLSSMQTARDNLYDPSYGKSLTAWVRDACYDPSYGQTLMTMLRGALYDGYQSWLYEIRAALHNPSTGSPWAYEGNVTLGSISSTIATMQGDLSAVRSDISTMRSSMSRLEACITWDNYLLVRT